MPDRQLRLLPQVPVWLGVAWLGTAAAAAGTCGCSAPSPAFSPCGPAPPVRRRRRRRRRRRGRRGCRRWRCRDTCGPRCRRGWPRQRRRRRAPDGWCAGCTGRCSAAKVRCGARGWWLRFGTGASEDWQSRVVLTFGFFLVCRGPGGGGALHAAGAPGGDAWAAGGVDAGERGVPRAAGAQLGRVGCVRVECSRYVAEW